jgi:hypothetical protein
MSPVDTNTTGHETTENSKETHDVVAPRNHGVVNVRVPSTLPRAVAAIAAIVLVATIAIAATGTHVGAQAQELTWSVRPVVDDRGARPFFSYTLEPGTTIRDVVEVTNRSVVPLEFSVYASDAFNSPNGAVDLLPGGEVPVDAGSWVTLDAATIVVEPGRTVDVPFAVAVPADAEPGDHAGGIVTSLVTTGRDATGSPVRVDRRLGSRVYVRVDGPLRPELEVRNLAVRYDSSLSPFVAGSLTVDYSVANTGNVRLQASQRLRASAPFGLLRRSVSPEDLPELLPGNSITMSERVGGVVPTFRTDVDVALAPYSDDFGDFGTALDVERSSTQVTTTPWSQLVVLAAVLSAVTWLMWRRRHRRTSEDRRVQDAVERALAAAGVRADEPMQPDAPPVVSPATEGDDGGPAPRPAGSDPDTAANALPYERTPG